VDRGDKPQVLMAADATDPTAIANASAALLALNPSVLQRDLPPSLRQQPMVPPFGVVFHARYNPEYVTALNIVPGLIGIILTLSTMMLTALSMTREREAGTMENLLAMPVRPLEVMLGKIIPYVGLGYAQIVLILVVAVLVFAVPLEGPILLLLAVLGLFILCNLALGFTFSTLAQSQMQALQMTQFFFLPSMLLSGFIFPFQGMPSWARWLGETLPLTHVMRICRGILLKGNGAAEIWPDAWPLALFAVAAAVVAVRSYRETLD
jgi:ABC-2 type transport system permease protein